MSNVYDDDDFDKIRDAATEASGDLLEDIVRLQRLADAQRPDRALKQRYEALRDHVTAELAKSGPRYFLDDDGNKRYAFAVLPESVVPDIEEIVELAEEGKLPKLDIEKVFPRKVDTEELRRALAKRQIPKEVVAKHIHIVPKTGHTRFADPVDDK